MHQLYILSLPWHALNGSMSPVVHAAQISVERPSHLETTSLGAAFAAGIGVGFWSKEWVLDGKQGAFSGDQGSQGQSWQPQESKDSNSRQYSKWKKAVRLSFGLADLAEPDQMPSEAL